MSNKKIYTVAFYNIENLFDTSDNKRTHDDDFLPHSEKRWTTKRYQNKLLKLGRVISKIGDENANYPPAIVGLAEVENKRVVEDLTHSEFLKDYHYDIVHYNSMDERGIDVALIYDKTRFEVFHSEPFSVYLEKEDGTRDYTRDILLVTGRLHNEDIHLIVNHWSSRREGEKETEYKRLASAETVNGIIEKLKVNYNDPKVIVMGDFNDNPDNNSLALIEEKSGLFNPFRTISTQFKGSLNHKFEWHLFDQILISTNFFDPNSTKLDFDKAKIFNSEFLTQSYGKYKGQPLRTFVGKRYQGGYSDHFPVYITLKEDE
jgi:endonuclease/exonuclease/phosphatase family metal-dependent hydrolase